MVLQGHYTSLETSITLLEICNCSGNIKKWQS